MTLTRRKALTLIGGGTVLAATGTIGGCSAITTPNTAIRPWALAGEYDDPRLNALSFALLAPNPHNLQPWQVRLEGSNGLTLMRDSTKALPETDPLDRQIFIGLGCFIEQMELAAGAAGYRTKVKLFPEGPRGPVAYAALAPGGKADPLAAQILKRGSCKEPFEDRAVPAVLANQLELLADIYTDPAEVAQLRKLTIDAWMVETMTPRTMQESVDLMRMGKAEINANPDGIDLGGAYMEGLMLAGLLSREILSDPDSKGFKQGLKMYHDMLMATPAYAVITTKGNSRADQIAAGRRWLRLNLATTGMGLSLHPVSQALQEYPEMKAHYAQAHQTLATKGQTVQMLGRLGYGPATQRTPRWPLETKLIDA